MSTPKDAEGNEAIVEDSNTWAILAAKRISADDQESRRCWVWVREIRAEACAVSGQEWRKCDHDGPLSPSRLSRPVLWGEQSEGGREGASSRMNPGKDRDSMSGSGSTQHTRPHACFSFSETGLFHNRAVFGPATGTVRGTWYTVAAVRSGGVGI